MRATSTRSGSSSTRKAAGTWSFPAAPFSRRSSGRALLKSGSRSSPARCCAGESSRCATSVRSSISAAGCRGCCTCPRWAGPASRIRRRSSSPARRLPSRSCASTTTSRRSRWVSSNSPTTPGRESRPPTRSARCITGRVTRVAEFGAFVELEPGVEALAHASTFAPTGRTQGWAGSVAPGTTGAFEILNIDLEKKRIGVALLPEGSARAGTSASSVPDIVPGARLKGKVERHEKFGVFVFLAPGRTGLIPLSESGLPRETDVAKAFPIGSELEVVVLDIEAPPGRRIRLSVKALHDAREADLVREVQRTRGYDASRGFRIPRRQASRRAQSAPEVTRRNL